MKIKKLLSHCAAVIVGILLSWVAGSIMARRAIPAELASRDTPELIRTAMLGQGGDFQIIQMEVPILPESSVLVWDKQLKYRAFDTVMRTGDGRQERSLYLPGSNPRNVAHILMDANGNPTRLICSTGNAALASDRPEDIAYDDNLDGRFETMICRDDSRTEFWLRTKDGWVKGDRDRAGTYILAGEDRRAATLNAEGYWSAE